MITVESNKNIYTILTDGRCGNCRAPVVSIEDGNILIKTRIERIDPNTGKVQYKCRECKQWLISPFYKIDFNKKACAS